MVMIGPADFMGSNPQLCKHGEVLVDCPECGQIYRDRSARRFNRSREAERRLRQKARRDG
jgi:predicted RNA-binding Zn-ribbon protein involved in translation (DUF1610 family)